MTRNEPRIKKMHFTKKIDRAFQWAGERMGGEAKTGHSDEFKMLETEMALRHDGMFPHEALGGSDSASAATWLTLSPQQAWTACRSR